MRSSSSVARRRATSRSRATRTRRWLAVRGQGAVYQAARAAPAGLSTERRRSSSSSYSNAAEGRVRPEGGRGGREALPLRSPRAAPSAPRAAAAGPRSARARRAPRPRLRRQARRRSSRARAVAACAAAACGCGGALSYALRRRRPRPAAAAPCGRGNADGAVLARWAGPPRHHGGRLNRTAHRPRLGGWEFDGESGGKACAWMKAARDLEAGDARTVDGTGRAAPAGRRGRRRPGAAASAAEADHEPSLRDRAWTRSTPRLEIKENPSGSASSRSSSPWRSPARRRAFAAALAVVLNAARVASGQPGAANRMLGSGREPPLPSALQAPGRRPRCGPAGHSRPRPRPRSQACARPSGGARRSP